MVVVGGGFLLGVVWGYYFVLYCLGGGCGVVG